jgi:Fe-S cluster assembly ATP-binding protein
MGLIITHTGFILDYVTADRGQVLFDGVMSCKTNPLEIFTCIRQKGYEECVRCSI